MTKEDAIWLFQGASRLADALKISRSAVSQWPDGKPIPELQELKIRYELRPDAFDESGLFVGRLDKSAA